MSLLTRILPSLLSIAFFLAVSLGRPSPPGLADPSAETRILHRQIDELRLRLRTLETPPPPAGLPRGMGAEPQKHSGQEPWSPPA